MKKLSLVFVFTPILASLLFIFSSTSVSSSGGADEIPQTLQVGSFTSSLCSIKGWLGGCHFCPSSPGQSFTGSDPVLCSIAKDETQNGNPGQGELLMQIVYSQTPFGSINGYTSSLYEEKPASAIAYFEDNWNKIKGDDQLVVAQDPKDVAYYRPGTGFTILQPLSSIWTWSRNLAYLMFIIVAIILAFAILFRKNLGGQNPVTILNSIPSIIISLILITFSYAISGFFIDVITIGSSISQSLLISGPGAPGNSIWQQNNEAFGDSTNKTWDSAYFLDDKPTQVNTRMIQIDDQEVGVWNALNTTGVRICADSECKILQFLPQNIQNGNALTQLVSVVMPFVNAFDNILINIILAFSTFMVSVKLFMLLLNKYVTLVLMVVVAPWYFFMGAFPSKTGSMIMMFIKIHLGAALTFVAVYTMFLLIIILGQSEEISNFAWAPPLMGYDKTFLESGDVIRSIIVIGTYLAIPAVPKFIDQILEVPDSNMVAKEVGDRVKGCANAAKGLGVGLIGSVNPRFAQRAGLIR